jgi:hypothetical protein
MMGRAGVGLAKASGFWKGHLAKSILDFFLLGWASATGRSLGQREDDLVVKGGPSREGSLS